MGNEGKLAEDKGDEDWKEARCVQCGSKWSANGAGEGDEVQYLDARFSSNWSMDSEVEQKIGMASKMIGTIERTVLGRKGLTEGTKVRVVNATYVRTSGDTIPPVQ